jgi:hypothetical protein
LFLSQPTNKQRKKAKESAQVAAVAAEEDETFRISTMEEGEEKEKAEAAFKLRGQGVKKKKRDHNGGVEKLLTPEEIEAAHQSLLADRRRAVCQHLCY